MAESVCIKLLTPQSFAIRGSVALFKLTPLWTTTSPNRISAQFLQSAIVLAACPKQSGCMGNDSTAWRIVPTSAFGGLMLTSKEYLQRAEECSQLANASSDVYVKKALTELASEFKATAKDLEQRNER